MVRYFLTPSLPIAGLLLIALAIPATPVLAQFKDQLPPPVVDREREAILTCVTWNEQLDTREAMFDFDCAYRMLSEPESDAARECEQTGLRLDEETEIYNENCGQYFLR